MYFLLQAFLVKFFRSMSAGIYHSLQVGVAAISLLATAHCFGADWWIAETATGSGSGTQCGKSSKLFITGSSAFLNIEMGITEFKQDSKILLYPIPFNDKLTVVANSNESYELTLFDITTRKILSETFNNSISINTERLQQGIYIYELKTKDGATKKGKLIKE